MHKQLIHFLTLLLLFAITSCSSNKSLRCAKKSTNYKVKKYRVKKNKTSNRAVGYGGGGSSASKSPAPKPTPAPAPSKPEPVSVEKEEEIIPEPIPEKIEEPVVVAEKTEEPVKTPEKEVESIPDLKIPPFQKPEKEVIEFKGEQIDLAENEFEYEEQLQFVDQTDLFTRRDEAVDNLKELTKLLKKDKGIKVTIIGNTASTTPQGDVLYGNSKEALAQEGVLNTNRVTLREVMIARAKRVYDLLIDQGVSSNQIDYTTGSHRQWAKERVVTFILRKAE